MDGQVQELLEQGPGPELGSILVEWFQHNQRELPWRTLFAETRDPFAIWISEIMLQQTTIQVVIPAYRRFLKAFPNVRALAAADEDTVRLACRGLGYYRRFRMMHAAARELIARTRAKGPFPWPRNFAGWRELPGVGDYTAAAVVSIAFGIPKAVVDGNVERVFCRLFDLRVVPDPKLKKVFQKVGDQLIPADHPGAFNQGLMELGQTICTKQKPACPSCPLQGFCLAYARGSQALAPQPKKAPDYLDVELHLLVMRRDQKVALVQRAANARFLGGTLGFPTAIEEEGGSLRWETKGDWPELKNSEALGLFQHSITKHRISARVHQIDMPLKLPSLVWVPLEDLETQLLSNLDRKALRVILKNSTAFALDTGFLN